MTRRHQTRGERDPGDAVPPGVAPSSPAPLTAEDRRVKRKLEHLGEDRPAAQPGDAEEGRAKDRKPDRG